MRGAQDETLQYHCKDISVCSTFLLYIFLLLNISHTCIGITVQIQYRISWWEVVAVHSSYYESTTIMINKWQTEAVCIKKEAVVVSEEYGIVLG